MECFKLYARRYWRKARPIFFDKYGMRYWVHWCCVALAMLMLGAGHALAWAWLDVSTVTEVRINWVCQP